MRGESAIRYESVTDDKASAGAAKPENGGSNFLRLTEPADGLIPEDLFHGLRLLGQHFGNHRSIDCTNQSPRA